MNGTLTLAGHTWPLQPDSLESMRGAVEGPWQGAIVDFLELWWGETEAIEVHTSGSTGDPRPLSHTKSDMVESARRTIAHFGLVPGTQAALAMPVQSAPIHDAVRDGDTAKLEQLLSEGVNVNTKDALVGTPLHMAAMTGRADAARILLENGARANMTGGMANQTPLQIAVTVVGLGTFAVLLPTLL